MVAAKALGDRSRYQSPQNSPTGQPHEVESSQKPSERVSRKVSLQRRRQERILLGAHRSRGVEAVCSHKSRDSLQLMIRQPTETGHSRRLESVNMPRPQEHKMIVRSSRSRRRRGDEVKEMKSQRTDVCSAQIRNECQQVMLTVGADLKLQQHSLRWWWKEQNRKCERGRRVFIAKVLLAWSRNFFAVAGALNLRVFGRGPIGRIFHARWTHLSPILACLDMRFVQWMLSQSRLMRTAPNATCCHRL